MNMWELVVDQTRWRVRSPVYDHVINHVSERVRTQIMSSITGHRQVEDQTREAIE